MLSVTIARQVTSTEVSLSTMLCPEDHLAALSVTLLPTQWIESVEPLATKHNQFR